MPAEWHDLHAVNRIDDLCENKELFRNTVANKKPYFMKYIYPSLMKEYNTYIKNTDRNALRKFQLTADELKEIPQDKRTDEQNDFIRYYNYRLPIGNNDCVMNKICRRFENEFNGYINKYTENNSFDYTIMKSDAEYTPNQFYRIGKLYREYNKRLSSYSTFMSRERIKKDEKKSLFIAMYNEFKVECDKICSNEAAQCNIVLDMCYKNRATKRFAWSMCGKQIIHNLLEKNNDKICYPVIAQDGEIKYCGNRYMLETKTIGADE